METLKHAFSRNRSSSSTSTPPSTASKHRDSPVEGSPKQSKPFHRRDSLSSKRDSGIGRNMLTTLNGKNHSRNPSGTSERSISQSLHSNGSLNVSERLEAVLAQTDDVDAANVAHLAQSISDRRKSHGLHGIHPGMLAKDVSPPGSSHSQQEFIHFSSATLARTRKAKAYYEIRSKGMQLVQQDGKSWNLLQCLRDREVRRWTGEQLDINLEKAKSFGSEGRTRDSPKGSSISSFGGTDSIGEGRTRGRKTHGSPIQSSHRSHIRQHGARHHADRFLTSQKGLEYWTIMPEEFLANYSWEQANPHRILNRNNEPINPSAHPAADEEGRSDGVGSNTSSFDYDRKAYHTRYSSDGGQLSPQISVDSPLVKSSSLKSPLRNVPSFAMPNASHRSRSPSPTRSTGKHARQTSDLLDIPRTVRRKIHDKIKGDRSGVSSRSHSPKRSDTAPAPASPPTEFDVTNIPRSSTIPQNLRLNMEVLATRRPTMVLRSKSLLPSPESGALRELARTRARLMSTGIVVRGVHSQNTKAISIAKCQDLMGRVADLDPVIAASFEQEYPKATLGLTTTLSALESRQSEVSKQVSSALTKTRTQTAVKIAKIAAEQMSTLLLQVKAVEDKMDALEYRTKSGWTHEKTLHLVFLVLEYIVMVVLWHLWALISVLRLTRQVLVGAWIVVWWLVVGSYRVVRWLLFLHP